MILKLITKNGNAVLSPVNKCFFYYCDKTKDVSLYMDNGQMYELEHSIEDIEKILKGPNAMAKFHEALLGEM